MKILTKPYHIKDYKFHLIVTAIAISIIGILVVSSAEQTLQNRHIMGLVLGVVVMVVVSLIDYIWLLNFYWVFYIFNILMLATVFFFGVTVNNAQRWLNLGFTTIQPAEITKILLILFFAKFIMNQEERISEFKMIALCVLLILPSLLLIQQQPDLSTSISIALTFCFLMYVGGLSYKKIGVILAVVIPIAVIFLGIVVQPEQRIISEYQQTRILAWLNPEQFRTAEAFQQYNAELAIGSGQLTGKGLNYAGPTSVKTGNFIAEAETDFIFAIVGEELGFIGSCIVIGLLLIIVLQCIIIGARAPDLAGRLICCGVAAQIGIQSFINIGVNTGILPNTGIPLPFVSYGLTSLVSMFIGLGLVLNVGLQPKKYQ